MDIRLCPYPFRGAGQGVFTLPSARSFTKTVEAVLTDAAIEEGQRLLPAVPMSAPRKPVLVELGTPGAPRLPITGTATSAWRPDFWRP